MFFVSFQRLLHGLNFSAELRSQEWNLCEFLLTVALCYKFSSSYQCKELYFFSNHSINTWLHCIPWSFYCKVGDSLLIRPKGDWSCAFTYSTSAMNNTTLLYGLQWLTLHNHVPIIQVFIWAVNSQPWLSHIISGAKKQERTSAHSLNTDALSTWQAHHIPLQSVVLDLGRCERKIKQVIWKRRLSVTNSNPMFILFSSIGLFLLLLSLLPSWRSLAQRMLEQGCCPGNKA